MAKRTPSTAVRSRDIGIDLGTANTLVYARGRGVVLDEPSVVAIDSRTGKVLAVGAEARQAVGRTPGSITATRPLKGGVITDFEATEGMLRYFIRAARGGRRGGRSPRVVVCVPSGVTGVERRAVLQTADRAGARSVRLIEEPMAAAIGAGLPVHEARGSMVVDIGGGSTEIAVISLGGMVVSHSARVAGDALDAAIAAYVEREFAIAVGERTAEDIKISLGTGEPVQVRGRDKNTGMPKVVHLAPEEIREAMERPVRAIVSAVRTAFDDCPPELYGDIMERGIVLTGGGALLHGLDERLVKETGMPVVVADEPLGCVALGTGRCLEEYEKMDSVFAA
ncbi:MULTISPECIES: rod shape-determining protein [unclassified Streptomyces]|uniref:rod shape-determining protein n=1 Tax=unclassified Streptomyces TaxID=2593676 RepID=UPI002DDAD3E3|nr:MULTISPECIES: rod shape-determining protein [unclassified Streptomyces]WSA92210.1 rod shape-determining protein [Streptomyces sp. NBC_01795]WSB76577.1 rod shape-determining protein [Streptomyces sp. NBC_01775]WSS15136.1 rod shape-determining protein [Streptomyces sp. NBC_01186]WSS43979.1 rod shape-determining protein [Streptomyces sp. NBC_01187]